MYFALPYTVEVVFVYEPLVLGLSYTKTLFLVYEPLYFDLSYTVEAVFVYEPLVFDLSYIKTPLLVYGTWLPGGKFPNYSNIFLYLCPGQRCIRFVPKES